ncbi:MAG: hypothetical protein HYR56_15720 [Acidobacteria bacterium]|nr:hypothetical protein [Acidobacteriota bacterium]
MQRTEGRRDFAVTWAARVGRLFVVLSLLVAAAAAQEENASSAGNLVRLLAGNVRFVGGKTLPKDYLAERPTLVAGQHPYAIVLACADSRLSPEILFDESLGKLFVVRTAGHVVDPIALGSIEYAVEHLHVNLLFVLGHESCGAVKATIGGGDAPPNIKALLRRIRPAVEKAYAQDLPERDLLNAAIKENVRYQMQEALFESDVLSESVLEKKLMMVGGVYNLQSGRVDLVVTDLAIAHNDSRHLAKDLPSQTAPAVNEQEAMKKHEMVEQPKTVKAERAPKAEKHKAEKAEHAQASEREKVEKTAPAHTAERQPAKAEREPAPEKRNATAPPPPAAEEKTEEHKEEPKKAAASASTGLARLADNVRNAYQAKQNITLKKTMLMRDERDRCSADDCRSIAAGESLSLDTPLILNVMGRPQLKVRHKGHSFYILADPDAIAVEVK